MQNCRSTNRGRAGLSILGTGANNVTFVGNRCTKGTQATSTTVSQGAGIAVEPSVATFDGKEIDFRNNQIEGILTVTHQTGGKWIDLRVADNQFTDGGIEIHRAHVKRFTINDNLVDEVGSIGIIVDSTAGLAHERGVIVGNSVNWTDNTGKTSLRLSTGGSGTAERILVGLNDFADSTSDATAIHDQGLSTNCYGRDNRKQRTTSPQDDDFL